MNTHSPSGRVQFNEDKLEFNQRSSHGTTQTQVELMGGGARSEWAGQMSEQQLLCEGQLPASFS